MVYYIALLPLTLNRIGFFGSALDNGEQEIITVVGVGFEFRLRFSLAVFSFAVHSTYLHYFFNTTPFSVSEITSNPFSSGIAKPTYHLDSLGLSAPPFFT
jgi:hypothetical protein